MQVARHRIHGPGGSLDIPDGDSVAVDLAMLIEGETSGRPLPEVLAEFGRSRSAYYEKLSRFREQGLEGLRARVPGPRSPWQRTFEVIRIIVTARLHDPARSAAAIQTDLRAKGHELSIRSVERTLSQFGMTRRG